MAIDPITGLDTNLGMIGLVGGSNGQFVTGTGGYYDPNLNFTPWSTTPQWTQGPQISAPTLGGISLPALPDLSSLYGPVWAQMSADIKSSGVADAAARDAARQRGIIQFGESPNFSGADLSFIGGGGSYDDFLKSLGNAGELAGENTAAGLSTVARLSDADKQAVQQITNVLGARGLTTSGETGYQRGLEATNYARAQFDARNKLIDYLGGIQQQFLQGERARQQQTSQLALQQAQVAGEGQMAQYNQGIQQAMLDAQTAAQNASMQLAASQFNAGSGGWTNVSNAPSVFQIP